MFENLTDRLNHTITQLRGQGRLTEDNIKQTLREVRMALLEADVALPVVKDFIDGIRERAVGAEVMQSLTPGQALVKIVQGELERVLGQIDNATNLASVNGTFANIAENIGGSELQYVMSDGSVLSEAEFASYEGEATVTEVIGGYADGIDGSITRASLEAITSALTRNARSRA